MSYFTLPSVSDSDLKSLRKAFYCFQETYDPDEVYKFGSLVDALLTEQHRVNHFYFSLIEEERHIYYSPSDFELAKEMARQAAKDPVIKAFIETGSGQHIFSRILKFNFDGEEHEIEGRCKFDSIRKDIGMGCSYKTTACTTRRAFIESIEHFNYDQQEAWYMDLGEIDRSWIFGMSKKTKEVFKIAVQRGDELYERGRQKYSFWAYRWLMFVDGFKVDENVS